MKKIDKAKYFPPGWNYSSELIGCAIALIAVAFVSFQIFKGNLDIEISKIVAYYVKNEKVFASDKMMSPFMDVMVGVYSLFKYYFIICVAEAVFHYRYFINSRSIYVMKRIKSRGDVLKRCIAGPVVMIITALIVIAVLTLIFGLIYYETVPEANMPDTLGNGFWRVF